MVLALNILVVLLSLVTAYLIYRVAPSAIRVWQDFSQTKARHDSLMKAVMTPVSVETFGAPLKKNLSQIKTPIDKTALFTTMAERDFNRLLNDSALQRAKKSAYSIDNSLEALQDEGYSSKVIEAMAKRNDETIRFIKTAEMLGLPKERPAFTIGELADSIDVLFKPIADKYGIDWQNDTKNERNQLVYTSLKTVLWALQGFFLPQLLPAGGSDIFVKIKITKNDGENVDVEITTSLPFSLPLDSENGFNVFDYGLHFLQIVGGKWTLANAGRPQSFRLRVPVGVALTNVN